MVGWRKLQNEELRNLYSLPNIIRMIKSRRMRWAGHMAHEREEKFIKIFGGKPKGKRLGGPRHGWEDIKIDLRETGWRVWTGFIWLRIETSGRLL
jgi:hypothetical protein